MSTKLNIIAILAALVLLAGCANQSGRTLYDDLGGRDTIDRIAGRFVAGVGADPEIRPFFMNTNLERFHRLFGEHICEIADGPCEYSGDTMEQVHIGMDINEAQFNYVVEILIDAMNAESIPYTVQNRLLARLAPMRRDIIYR